MNSRRPRKECFKEGNTLTVQKAKDQAKEEESVDTQLKLMSKTTEVNTVKKHLTRKASKSDNKHSCAETLQKHVLVVYVAHMHVKSAKRHFWKKVGLFPKRLPFREKETVYLTFGLFKKKII